MISRLTIVEMESVFALKARTGEIDQQAVLIARRRLEADVTADALAAEWDQRADAGFDGGLKGGNDFGPTIH